MADNPRWIESEFQVSAEGQTSSNKTLDGCSVELIGTGVWLGIQGYHCFILLLLRIREQLAFS